MRGPSLALLFLLSFTVQAAKQSSTPNRFGAIAYERASKAWGVSYDKVRARDAELDALRQCGQKRCEVVHKFKNGCAALADGPKAKAPAAASGASRDEAETKALKRCGPDCSALAWGCTR